MESSIDYDDFELNVLSVEQIITIILGSRLDILHVHPSKSPDQLIQPAIQNYFGQFLAPIEKRFYGKNDDEDGEKNIKPNNGGNYKVKFTFQDSFHYRMHFSSLILYDLWNELSRAFTGQGSELTNELGAIVFKNDVMFDSFGVFSSASENPSKKDKVFLTLENNSIWRRMERWIVLLLNEDKCDLCLGYVAKQQEIPPNGMRIKVAIHQSHNQDNFLSYLQRFRVKPLVYLGPTERKLQTLKTMAWQRPNVLQAILEPRQSLLWELNNEIGEDDLCYSSSESDDEDEFDLNCNNPNNLSDNLINQNHNGSLNNLTHQNMNSSVNNLIISKASNQSPSYEDSVKQYNTIQSYAIQNGLEAIQSSGSKFKTLLIQGPPGTGKTHTLLGLIQKLTQCNRKTVQPLGILICTTTNGAVDEVGRRILRQRNHFSQELQRRLRVVRIGVRNRVHEDVTEIYLDNLVEECVKQREIKNASEVWNDLQRCHLQEADIILSTLTSSQHPAMEAVFREPANRIRCLIVDEAAQCTEPELLMPLIYPSVSKMILIGDHKQLPAIIKSKKAEAKGLGLSLFERLYRYFRKCEIIQMYAQYRMRLNICRFPSATFYNGMLKAVKGSGKNPLIPLRSYWVFDLSHTAEMENKTYSKCNPEEANFVVTLIEAILAKCQIPWKEIMGEEEDYEVMKPEKNKNKKKKKRRSRRKKRKEENVDEKKNKSEQEEMKEEEAVKKRRRRSRRKPKNAKTTEENIKMEEERKKKMEEEKRKKEEEEAGKENKEVDTDKQVKNEELKMKKNEKQEAKEKEKEEEERRKRKEARDNFKLPFTIGVITFYKWQKRVIEEKLGARLSQLVEVNTVDSYQGQERDIVILSCVRAQSKSIGFVKQPQRMNVALTRAKSALFVCLCAPTFKTKEPSGMWAMLIKDAKRRGDLYHLDSRIPWYSLEQNILSKKKEPKSNNNNNNSNTVIPLLSEPLLSEHPLIRTGSLKI